MHMKEPTTRKMYNCWSLFYESTFGALVARRQQRAVEELNLQPGDRLLDLGIGTGMLLEHYRRDVEVFGVDLSDGMLRKAEARRRELGLDNCHLILGDALHPPFADGSFDRVMLSHTISVVSDPAGLMNAALRMVRPGGRVVVLNHFRSEFAPMAWFEHVLNPLFLKIGWKSDLALDDVLGDSRIRVDYRFKMHLLDLWQIVVLTRLHDGEEAQVAAAPQPPLPELQSIPAGVLAVDGPA